MKIIPKKLLDGLKQAEVSLAAKGMIYDTGQRRNGEVVWGLTPKGSEAEAADARRRNVLPFSKS
jgi:hypothetical protein